MARAAVSTRRASSELGASRLFIRGQLPLEDDGGVIVLCAAVLCMYLMLGVVWWIAA